METIEFLRAVLDANPNVILVVDEDIRINEYNEAAKHLLGNNPDTVLQQRGGDVLHCIHSMETPLGCGHSSVCHQCAIRNSVNKAIDGHKVHRLRTRMTLVHDDEKDSAIFLITASPFQFQNQNLVLLVLEDISEFMELREIVPICAKCKKIRQDDDYWNIVEKFMEKHLDVQFSHGYCPTCAKEFMDQLDNEDVE